MTNADLFRKIFGLYAEEFWSLPTDKMTAWLVADAPTAEPSPENCWGCNCPKMVPSAETRWIPVVERLPLKPGFYLVTVGAPYKPVRVYEYNPCEGYENGNLWKGEGGAYVFNWFVEAWQNLPEPWKGEADDTD